MFCSKFGSGDPGAGPSEERAEGGRGVFNGKMDSDLDLPLGGVWPAGPRHTQFWISLFLKKDYLFTRATQTRLAEPAAPFRVVHLRPRLSDPGRFDRLRLCSARSSPNPFRLSAHFSASFPTTVLPSSPSNINRFSHTSRLRLPGLQAALVSVRRTSNTSTDCGSTRHLRKLAKGSAGNETGNSKSKEDGLRRNGNGDDVIWCGSMDPVSPNDTSTTISISTDGQINDACEPPPHPPTSHQTHRPPTQTGPSRLSMVLRPTRTWMGRTPRPHGTIPSPPNGPHLLPQLPPTLRWPSPHVRTYPLQVSTTEEN